MPGLKIGQRNWTVAFCIERSQLRWFVSALLDKLVFISYIMNRAQHQIVQLRIRLFKYFICIQFNGILENTLSKAYWRIHCKIDFVLWMTYFCLLIYMYDVILWTRHVTFIKTFGWSPGYLYFTHHGNGPRYMNIILHPFRYNCKYQETKCRILRKKPCAHF